MNKIFRDYDADSVFIKNGQGAFFTNQLKAIAETDGTITVRDEVSDIEIISHFQFGEFVKEDDSAHGTNQLTVVDALNAVFTGTGSDPRKPEITSSLTININEGDSINYVMEADRGLLFEFVGLPDGILMVEGKPRNIIGGTGLSDGTYTATMRAVNYFGEDVKTLTIIVGAVSFASTFATKFSINDRAQVAGLEVESVLGRNGEGVGLDDAWTMNGWVKPTVTSDQQLFSFGNDEGQHQLIYNGDESVSLRYGDGDNYVEVKTDPNTVPVGGYKNITTSYDGGTTGFSGEKFEGVVVGGETLDNPSFDTDGVWSRTGVSIVSGDAKFTNSEGTVAQGFRAGENLIYDATINYKGGIGGGGVRSHVKLYRYNSSTSLDDAKAGIVNGMGADVDITELKLNSQNVSGTVVAEWMRRITINESTIDGILNENSRGKVYVFEGLLDLPAGDTTFYVRSDAGYEFTFDGSVVSSFDGDRAYGTADTVVLNSATGGQHTFSIIYYCSSSATGGFLVSTDSSGNNPVNFDNLLSRPTLSYADIYKKGSVRNLSTAQSTVANDGVDGRFYTSGVNLPFVGSGTIVNNWFNSVTLHREDIDNGIFGSITDKVIKWHMWLELPAGTTELYLQSDDGFEFVFDGTQLDSYSGERGINSTPDNISITVPTAGVYYAYIIYFNGSGNGGLKLATDVGMTTPVSTSNILVTTSGDPRDIKFKVFDSSGTTVDSVDFSVNDSVSKSETFQFSVPFSKDLFVSVEDTAYSSTVMNADIESVSIIASDANNPDYLTGATDFFTRFKVYVDGTESTTSGSIKGNGWSKSLPSDRMYFGRDANQTTIDEWSIYNGVQSGVANSAYNGGSTVDLNTITPTPDHWWSMGDGDTFPTLKDSVGSADLTMINMTVADIVNDTP